MVTDAVVLTVHYTGCNARRNIEGRLECTGVNTFHKNRNGIGIFQTAATTGRCVGDVSAGTGDISTHCEIIKVNVRLIVGFLQCRVPLELFRDKTINNKRPGKSALCLRCYIAKPL